MATILYIPLGILHGEDTFRASIGSMLFWLIVLLHIYYNYYGLTQLITIHTMLKTITYSSFVILFIGYLQYTAVKVGGPFGSIYTVLTSIFALLPIDKLNRGVVFFGSEPASASTLFALTIPVLLGRIIQQKNKKEQKWYILLILLFIPLFISSGSASVWITLLLTICATFIVLTKNLKAYKFLLGITFISLKILEKISKKKVFPVIDPTLLIDHSEWNNIIKDLNSSSITNKENYIFCYFLSNNNWYNKVISSLNPQKKYIIYSVGTSAPYSYKVKNATIIHPTPIEFIAYINHAKYIITDSFHGTIFAINFNKNFIALKRNNDTDKNSENQRFYSLLQKLNLLDYFLGKNEQYDINKIKAIDYNLINLKLNLLREQSINFLNQSLKDSKHE